MEIQLIDSMEEFERMRPSWDRVFDLDPNASVFMAWWWLRAWADVAPYGRWAVLAARPHANADWVGFLPVTVRGDQREFRFDQVREIYMAGDPGADYTGFVCLPQHERAAIHAMADFLKARASWERLRFKEVSDARLDIFLNRLTSRNLQRLENGGTCCPYVPLPKSWEQYMRECPSNELRKKMRMVQREFQVKHLDCRNADEQIDGLLQIASTYDYHAQDEAVNRFRRLFSAAVTAGAARMLMIWDGATPVAGVGGFFDEKANSLCIYLTAFDHRYFRCSPGRVVNALAIQYAIDQKMQVVDFLRGDESYKFQFGAKRRFTRNVTVVKRGIGTATRMTLHRTRELLGI